MECCIKLRRNGQTDNIIIPLRADIPIFTTENISSIVLIEDAYYTGQVQLYQKPIPAIDSVRIFRNGKEIGVCEFTSIASDDYTMDIRFDNKLPGNSQPFLLQYDLLLLSIQIQSDNNTVYEYYSDYILCVSKHQDDTENIENMIKELTAFEDDKINEWLFSNSSKSDIANGLMEGSFKNKSYKSINSYIQLLEEIYNCYIVNLQYFRSHAKHTIIKQNSLVSYLKVRTVSVNGFSWLMQNSDQLISVSQSTSIYYKGNNYLPLRMRSDEQVKNRNVYENRVVMGFLNNVFQCAFRIYTSFNKDISEEERILQRLLGIAQETYKPPIITIKRFQISSNRLLLSRLVHLISMFRDLLNQYSEILPCTSDDLKQFPKKTKTFQEVISYNQVFDQIIKWFKFGEFDLKKDKLLLQIKTLDKLFEYFCLYKLLKMLRIQGFDSQKDGHSAHSHEYRYEHTVIENERDVANTYYLQKDNNKITLYYQPVIHSFYYQNGITLFRATTDNNYYNPDFLLKITNEDFPPQYIVLDAKFSTRVNIKRHQLEDTVCQYFCQLSSNDTNCIPISMVWILQGRIDNEPNIYKYEGTPLSKRVSIGIVSVNTKNQIPLTFWQELYTRIMPK